MDGCSYLMLDENKKRSMKTQHVNNKNFVNIEEAALQN
jgi:hypothetical protein